MITGYIDVCSLCLLNLLLAYRLLSLNEVNKTRVTHYCDLCSLCTLGQYWDQFSIEFILQCAHFTVTGGNEAGVDLVLIQPCLLYYVNHVVLMLTSIFISKIYIRKGRRFVSKQDQPQPHVHSKPRTLGP